MSPICSPFSSQLIVSFSTDCLALNFYLDCTRWCRFMFLTNVDPESQCCRKGNYTATWLHHQHNSNTWLMSVTSLSASPLHKLSTATDRLCQIALNQKLLRKFEKWCKFSSHIQAILRKKKSGIRRPTCITIKNVNQHSS